MLGWRHDMGTFSAWLDICEGKCRPPMCSPHKGPVMRSFHIFFYVRQNVERLNKRWCDVTVMSTNNSQVYWSMYVSLGLDKLSLVQVMAQCYQAGSHNPNGWFFLSSLKPCDITKPGWVSRLSKKLTRMTATCWPLFARTNSWTMWTLNCRETISVLLVICVVNPRVFPSIMV